MNEPMFILKNAVDHFKIFRACGETKSFDDCLEWAILVGVPPRNTGGSKRHIHQQPQGEICPKCGGTGHFHFYKTMTFKDCVTCKGTGRLSPVR